MFAIYDNDPGEAEVDRCCDKYRSNSNTYQVPDGLAIERIVKIQLKFAYILLCVPTLMAWHRPNENVTKIGDKLTS